MGVNFQGPNSAGKNNPKLNKAKSQPKSNEVVAKKTEAKAQAKQNATLANNSPAGIASKPATLATAAYVFGGQVTKKHTSAAQKEGLSPTLGKALKKSALSAIAAMDLDAAKSQLHGNTYDILANGGPFDFGDLA